MYAFENVLDYEDYKSCELGILWYDFLGIFLLCSCLVL
jgi:hypothetical protein